MRAVLFLCLCLSLHADEFPKPFNTGNDVGLKPMAAEEAVKLIKMPPGFKATVFAAEPDVQNPIACAWDSRGRLWIAENYTYADSKTNFDKTLRDRILIFEDTDNDGRHDKRTVFADNLQNLAGIELGYGGVYATAAPNLLFISDKNGDDKPDGPAEVLLDGFAVGGVRHNLVNGIKWGPDGWLYGRHGILATSKVGAPGTPDAQRLSINVGIWRYHPVRRAVEMVTWGGTNPWGHDWNAEGEGFFTNTVTGHLYHIIPGAHYERMYGEDPNPHIYQLLPQTADHYHYDRSKNWTDSRDGKANDFGGGHAHIGCMIYLGNNWPHEYRGKLFTLNFHGRRINVNRLERKGCGYVGKSEPDMIFFGDPWFRGIDLTYGPDGGVYVLDWSDQGECHENDGVHRESGRIYKIMYSDKDSGWGVSRHSWDEVANKGGLKKLSDEALTEIAFDGSDWAGRMAIRVLGERGTLNESAMRKSWSRLYKMFPDPPYGSLDLGYMALDSQYLSRAGMIREILRAKRATRAAKAASVTDLSTLDERALLDFAIMGTQWGVRGSGPYTVSSEWFGNIARRLLAERAADGKGKEFESAAKELRELFAAEGTISKSRLRALWTLNLIGKLDGQTQKLALKSADENVQAWGIRLAADVPRGFPRELPSKNPAELSEFVLLAFAGTAQNSTSLGGGVSTAYDCWLPPSTRLSSAGGYEIAQLVPMISEKADDVLVQTLWSGMTAVEIRDRGFIGMAARRLKQPALLRSAARYLGTSLARMTEEEFKVFNGALDATSDNPALVQAIVLGLSDSMKGVRKSALPKSWAAFSAKAAAIPAIADKVRELNVVFGDGRALDEIRGIVLDAKGDLAGRRRALESLITAKAPELRATLEKLAKENEILPDALRGLAAFDDAAKIILARLPAVKPDQRPAVVGALCNTAAGARALLDAVAAGGFPRAELTAYHARQIATLGATANDTALTEKLATIWGAIRTTPDDKKRRIASLRAALTPDVLAKADIKSGRSVYSTTCAACHTLYDLGQDGANLGPNLTGGGRDNLDYLLENMVDPNAIVPADFKLSVLTLKDGRVLSGFVSAQTADMLTLRTMTDTQTLPRADVTKTEVIPQSLMPEGQLDALTPEQIRDLVAFLMKK